jgi:pyridoxamine 5'-phosphate oxidase
MSIDFGGMREQYSNTPYNIEDAAAHPFDEFHSWFAQAIEGGIKEPNAMTLATVDQNGHADARIVLLKELTTEGFVFYTNYNSAKGQQLFDNPHACIVFLWLEMERQIRIKGEVKIYDQIISTSYFQSRPRSSQVAAWASLQSKEMSRASLEESFQKMDHLFQHTDKLPKPPYWGGYMLVPTEIEFWQGRRNRMHDRVKYSLDEKNSTWSKVRLAP